MPHYRMDQLPCLQRFKQILLFHDEYQLRGSGTGVVKKEV